ncbi:tuftelin isoform X2 [Chamaea fasciata]|uniref:tuftelin isoform X2 n=1 Tax=Chamaea fasciata TaxID=190680 RepID=UPI00336AE501
MNGLRGWAELRESPEPSMRRPTEFPEFPGLENSPGKLLENSEKPTWNPEEAGPVLKLLLPREVPGEPRPKQKPVGRAFAMVAKRSDGNSLASECVKSKDGDEEIIKVYLKARAEHEEPVTQLKSEVRHIQEAGSVLKKLREDLSTKLQTQPEFQEFREFREFRESSEVVLERRIGSCSCPERLRGKPREDGDTEVPRLLRRLQEAENRLQLERENFQGTESRLREQRERAEAEAAQRERQLRELRGTLESMETSQRDLLAQVQSGQAELQRLRDGDAQRAQQQERSSQLEKEVATLREKIHHLDDMLKSQQRKVRHMIEQLQNSKSVIQAKDAAIQELKERVSYLEAENLEMHDRIEHLIEAQVSRAGATPRGRSKSEHTCSKHLPGPKPLIRVVET